MATVKLQDGNVVLRDGIVSCECCELCPELPDEFIGIPEITKEQYDAISLGGVVSYTISAIAQQSGDCGGLGNRAEYNSSSSYFFESGSCFSGAVIPTLGIGVGSQFFFNRLRKKIGQQNKYFIQASLFSFGGFSGPSWAFWESQINNPLISSVTSSLTINGESINSGLFIPIPNSSFPSNFTCTYQLTAIVDFTSNI